MEYTIEVHVNRMRKFLECEDLCEGCPATLGFWWGYPDIFGNKKSQIRTSYSGLIFEKKSACFICREFMEISNEPISLCPCHVFGKNEAIAAAHKALELWDAGQHPMQEKYDGEPDGL